MRAFLKKAEITLERLRGKTLYRGEWPKMVAIPRRWLSKNEKGVTTVEYAVMLALVALAVALSAPNIQDSVIQVFEDTSNALQGKGTCCD